MIGMVACFALGIVLCWAIGGGFIWSLLFGPMVGAYFAAVYAMLTDELPTFSRKKFRGTDDPRLRGK